MAPTEVSDASQHYHGRSTSSSYTGANNELHYNSSGDISSDENKNIKYEYNVLGLVSKVRNWSPSTGQAETTYRYSAAGELVESIEKNFQGAVIFQVYYRDGQRHDTQDGSVYVGHEVGALRIMPDANSQRIYYQNDHLGNVILAWSDLNGDGVIKANTELLEESAYYPYGFKRQEYRTQTDDVPFAYNGAEENKTWGLHLTTYRTMAPELALWGQVDPKAEWDYGTSPYASMRGNPISYADPDGDFITWSVHGGGFSIGVNFTPIGLTFGGGLNFGFRGGFSLGAYGEVGPRIGGDGFGAGATVTQSFDYNFRHGQGTSTTSAGVYKSFGPVNTGANVSVSYGAGRKPVYNWGVSAGVGVGDPQKGVGLFVGYGSGGLNAGLGGYYDPRVNLSKTDRVLTANQDGSYSDYRDERDFVEGESFESGDYATGLQGNPNVGEVANGDGSYSYTLTTPERFKVTSAVGSNVTILSSSSRNGQFTFTTLDRARSMTFTGRQLYSGNRFNFNNFNVGSNRSSTNVRLNHFNLFGNSWFR